MAPPNPAVINRRLPPALIAIQRERLPQPALYSRSQITNFVLVAVFHAALALVTFLLVNPITPAPPVFSLSWLQGILDLLPIVPAEDERAQLLPYAVASENIYASLGTTIYLSALGFVTLMLALTSLRIADRAVDMMDADDNDLPISILFTRDGILFFALVIQVELFGNSPQKAERALQDMLLAYRASQPPAENQQYQQHVQNTPQTPKAPALPTPPVSSAEKSRSKKKSKGLAKKKKPAAQSRAELFSFQPQTHYPEDVAFAKNSRNSIDNSDLTPSQERSSYVSMLEPVPEPLMEEPVMPEEEEEERRIKSEYVIIKEPTEEASAEDNEEGTSDDFDYHPPSFNNESDEIGTEESEYRHYEEDEQTDQIEDSDMQSEDSGIHLGTDGRSEENQESEVSESVEESEEQQSETVSDVNVELENQRSYTSIWEFGKHIDLLRGIYPTTSIADASNSAAKPAVPPGFEEDDQLDELPFTERTSSRFTGYFTSKNRQQQQPIKQSPSNSMSAVERMVPNMVAPPPRNVHLEATPPTAGAAWRWKVNNSGPQGPQTPQYPATAGQYPRPYTTSIASPHNYPQAYSQDISTWRNSAYHRRVSSAATTMSPSPAANGGYAPPGYYNQAFSSLNVSNRSSSGMRNNSTSSSSFFASNASMMSNPENPNPYAPPKRNYSRNNSSSSNSYPACQSYQPQQQHAKEKRYYN